MTLGFDAVEYLEAVLDKPGARKVLVAMAKHAPKKPIRVGHYVGDDTYDVQELDADGTTAAPKDLSAILAAIKKAGKYVDWPYDGAPEGVPPIILPGAGWDLDALVAEPAWKKLVKAERLCAMTYGTDRAKVWLDARGKKLLRVAEKHRLVLVYR